MPFSECCGRRNRARPPPVPRNLLEKSVAPAQTLGPEYIEYMEAVGISLQIHAAKSRHGEYACPVINC